MGNKTIGFIFCDKSQCTKYDKCAFTEYREWYKPSIKWGKEDNKGRYPIKCEEYDNS